MGPETQAKISRTVLALVSSHLTRLAKVAPVSTGKRPAHGRKLCPHMARGGPHSSQQRVTPRPVGTRLHGKNDIYNPNHDGTNDGDSKADTAKGWCRWPYEGMGRVRSVEQAQAWRARLRLFLPDSPPRHATTPRLFGRYRRNNREIEKRLRVLIWLILPVVICLSQRLSHACLSTYFYIVKPRMAH
jgi:hypothetical protein